MKKRHVQKIDMLGKELTQIALQSSISKRSEIETLRFDEELVHSDRTEQASEREAVQTEATPESRPTIDIPDDEFKDRNESGTTASERERSKSND